MESVWCDAGHALKRFASTSGKPVGEGVGCDGTVYDTDGARMSDCLCYCHSPLASSLRAGSAPPLNDVPAPAPEWGDDL